MINNSYEIKRARRVCSCGRGEIIPAGRPKPNDHGVCGGMHGVTRFALTTARNCERAHASVAQEHPIGNTPNCVLRALSGGMFSVSGTPRSSCFTPPQLDRIAFQPTHFRDIPVTIPRQLADRVQMLPGHDLEHTGNSLPARRLGDIGSPLPPPCEVARRFPVTCGLILFNALAHDLAAGVP